MMKKTNRICLLLSVLLLLAGCGGKSGSPVNDGEELYDIEVTEETTELPLQTGEALCGAQFYQGERIWLLGNLSGQVFGYHEEKKERELLLEHIPAACIRHMLYRTEENFFAYNNNRLTILDSAGEEVKTVYAEGSIITLCESRGGSIVLAVEGGNGVELKILDKETGTLTGDYVVPIGFYGIAAGVEQEVLVIDWDGVYDIDMESGRKSWLMKWSNTSYSVSSRLKYAARIKEDGSLEQIEREEDTFYIVELRKINPVEMGKTILTFRTVYAVPILKELVAKFNKENKEYHVLLQEMGSEGYEEFLTRTDMEIAAGKGPDLIADAVTDMGTLAEKGGLENLEPYLTQEGIDRESYQRDTFQSEGMEDGIYSLSYNRCISSVYIKEGFVDSNGQADIKTFLENLESYENQAVFDVGMEYTPIRILAYFFRMSDNFYGMVDWEERTCDFSGELWEQMLRVAKQYGLTERNREWEEIMISVNVRSLLNMAFWEREAKENGTVLTGYPSENGMVPWSQMDSVAINAGSAHKDGAWQFVRFLLSEEAQKLLAEENIPMHEGVLREGISKYLEEYCTQTNLPNGGIRIRPEIPEGTEEKFWECLENAKPASYRTELIIDIIMEETDLYFTGDKTIEEVSDVIENRVKLYLAELE